MKIYTKRFGLPYNPKKEKRAKNKITRHIIIFLLLFVVIAVKAAISFEQWMRTQISQLLIADTIDSVWIGSLASYWGGIIGGLISGTLAFLGVFYTIKYYKESDQRKERTEIQPFLLVTIGASKNSSTGFELGAPIEGKDISKEINVTIKNIGNGFAKTLVVHTGYCYSGMAYDKVISVGNEESLFFMADPSDISKGLSFAIQFVDAARNEYIQQYSITEEHGKLNIECGYPDFLEQR